MTNEFGGYLRELRGKMTLREAAIASGISHTYISDLEKGNKIDPSNDTLMKLAKAYGTSWGDLSSSKNRYIDFPRSRETYGGPNKTPIETMGYFQLADENGYIFKEHLEEITILINDYDLNVGTQEFGNVLYQEFLDSMKELSNKQINEIQRKLEIVVFEGFRKQDDLINILKKEETTYKGVELSEDDRQYILYALESISNKEPIINNDLSYFIKQIHTTYNHQPLTDQERQRILDMLKVLFPNRQ
jgi:transcriptional regulator with XRE-family HTH domain